MGRIGKRRELKPVRGKRRLISFDEDIADEVVERTGGRFTREQVLDVWRSYVSYVRGILAQTDCVRVIIPNLGVLENNVTMINRRLAMIKYIYRCKGRLRTNNVRERDNLLRKRDVILEESRKRSMKDPAVVKNKRNINIKLRDMHMRYKWEEIQDFQAKEFENL